jgi:hypothetical protein
MNGRRRRGWTVLGVGEQGDIFGQIPRGCRGNLDIPTVEEFPETIEIRSVGRDSVRRETAFEFEVGEEIQQ